MTTVQDLPQVRGVKNIPLEEQFTSGHRTCQGCESALVMRLMVKASGPRTIVLGSTGCMYVANTTYYSTPWVVPWMHTQLGSSGSAATGTAAGLASMMRKGKMKEEPINVIAFCGDGGGVDMGLSAISAALQHDEYNLLILCYDNESYANTDIQVSGSSPWGANSTFSPPGTQTRIMNKRWKKNTAPMLATGHPGVRYVATACGSYGLDFNNKIRRALTIGGPTFIHSIGPVPQRLGLRPQVLSRVGHVGHRSGPLGPVRDHRRRAHPQRPVPRHRPRHPQAEAGGRLPVAPRPLRPLHPGRHQVLPRASRRKLGKWWAPGVVPFRPHEE